MRFCPFCAGELGDQAQTCGHCGRVLPARRMASPSEPTEEPIAATGRPAPDALRPLVVAAVATPNGAPADQPLTLPDLTSIAADAQQAADRVAISSGDPQDRVGPMPPAPPAGLITALPYVFQVVRARLERQRAIRSLRKRVRIEAMQLEDAFRDLGVAARQQQTDWAGVETELETLRSMEQVHAGIVQATEQLDEQGQQAEAHYAESEADCMARMEKERARIERTQQELDQRLAEQAELKALQAEQERQIRMLSKERDDRRAQAMRERQAHEREAQQRLAAEKAIEIGDWSNRKERTVKQLKDLLEPIDDLRRTLLEARAAVAQAQRDVNIAKQELAGTRRQIEDDRRRHHAELARVNKEIARQLVYLGRAAEKNPQGHDGTSPHVDAFMARIGQHRQEIGELKQRAEQLQAESETYDRPGWRKGLLWLAALSVSAIGLIATVAILILR